MQIKEIITSHADGRSRVEVATDLFEPLYYEFDQAVPDSNIGELVLVSLLLPAMTQGEPFTLPPEFPICPQLLQHLEYFQEVFSDWFPQLSRIELEVSRKPSPSANESGGVCLFSGGVDGLYTFSRVKEQVDTLLLCRGIDIQLSEEDRFNSARSFCQQYANRNQVRFVTVETNYRQVIKTFRGSMMHATIYVALALALSPRKLFVAGSHTLQELEPWGSHPLTDPLMSTASTEVIHHGAARRSTKLAWLARDQEALDLLRVCNSSEQYNCSECEKCLRTMFTLEVLGRQSRALQALDRERLRRLRIYSESEATFWRDNSRFAREHQQHELARLAEKILHRYELKLALRKLRSLVLARPAAGTTGK